MTRFPLMRVRVVADERGSVLVITAVVMTTLLVFAAYAIDTGIWFVHHGHLQTEADAAALAGAQNFQYPCTAGGTMDRQIEATVHRYDGTMASSGGYNQQVPVTPTSATIYSPTQHNLISQINQPDFVNQSQPNDSELTGSPCKDAAIDVKLTETNLPSFFPFVHPEYINARARVSIEKLTSTGSGAAPLAEPLPTPNAMTAYLIDEGNKNAVLDTVKLTPVPETNNASWTTASEVPFTFNATGPIGMEIAENAGSGTVPCENKNGNSCYDATDNMGITYTRVWSNSGTPGVGSPPAPAQAEDATLSPAESGGCPLTSGTFSNFISNSSTCSVRLKATVLFAAGAVCGNEPNVALSLKATDSAGNTQTPAMTCEGAAEQTAAPCSGTTPCVKTTWTSGAVTVGHDSPDGPVTFALKWTQKYGTIPSGAEKGSGKNGFCTAANACSGTFGTVQRAFNGAYDSQTATSSHSGGVLAASLTDSSGKEIQSVKSATATTVNISVKVLSFQNSQEIGSPPVELSFGGNQENGAVSCPGLPAGKGELEKSLVEGCTQPFQLNTNFSVNPCAATTEPLDCLPENPGNGKLDQVLDGAMNTRINGSKNAGCKAFNYWAAGNTLPELLDQRDPRLLTLFTTDYGALSNGRNEVPVREIADFYVTGWEGDPCVGHEAEGTPTLAHHTHDEEPSASANGGDPAGVLLGHFVQYTEMSPTGKGEGQCLQSASLGNCIAVLTK